MNERLVRTAITSLVIFTTMGAYILQVYGAYTAQQANLHESASGEIDAGYIVSGALLNSIVTVYLIYYLFNVRFEKHGDVFKTVGAFLLIIGMFLDIFLAVFVLDLIPATVDKKVWETYGWIYSISTMTFLSRIFYIVQFQCSDIGAPKIKAQFQENQFKKPFVQQTAQPRPERGPNPFVKTEEGGGKRRKHVK
jgi:hypothetical protein